MYTAIADPENLIDEGPDGGEENNIVSKLISLSRSRNNFIENLGSRRFCILVVQTYGNVPGGQISKSFVPLVLEDTETGDTWHRTSGFLGYAFFFGLKSGHTYKIIAYNEYESEPFTINRFFTFEDICVYDWQDP